MQNEIKRFSEWTRLKKKLHFAHNRPRISEGEVWWAAVGENIGTEVNGKHKVFSRPVLVLKKFNRNGFLAIPLTSKQKEGSWYMAFYLHNKRETAILSQARNMSVSRLYRRLGRVSDRDFAAIQLGFFNLIFRDNWGKNVPSAGKTEGSRVNLENLPLLYQITAKKSSPPEDKPEDKNEN